ncbi:NAD-dependent epimerase/dehydratase family protein [Bacillus sp. DJP31]|uniref:NAD-dependent epimerase/dehydratase family protein n=1 Tax=Bacillus sp. DJP31 TaxID=3409789 RepID=UPI003BB63A18
MNILILGGTRFLGRHLVDECMRRGHEVSIFTRGKTNSELYPDIERLIGDRDGDISSLKGKKWDAVIDTSGYVPRIVNDSTSLLASSCNVYTFISSISVYKDFSNKGLTEESAVATLEDETVEEITGETYGALKALCEVEVKKTFPDRHLIIRPGLIVGPYDHTDRFTFWPKRMGSGGEILAPGDPKTPVLFIDVRDLASFVIQQLENKSIGTYHVTGPNEALSMGEFLGACQEALTPNARLTWVGEKFLDENEVKFWTDLPIYIPIGVGMDGFSSINTEKAFQAGLTVRPLKETIKDTYDWCLTRDENYEFLSGLQPERELRLLKSWNDQVKS